MAVNIAFTCDGVSLTESSALDFSLATAGSSSPIKTVTVTNTGSSDALDCVLTAVEASTVQGFSSNLQIGTPQETYLAQQFAPDIGSANYYSYAVLGVGKNFAANTGGTLQNTSGSDSFATKWSPPTSANSGSKSWGNALTWATIT